MRTFSVTSVYSIDNINVSAYSGSDRVINITFDINYPDGIRNSKKAFKNLLKSSSDLREILAEEVRQFLSQNQCSFSNNRSYACGTVLGKNCEINIYLGQDFINKPINSYTEELLRKINTR